MTSPALGEAERRAIIAYRKVATEEDYPRRVVDRQREQLFEDCPACRR